MDYDKIMHFKTEILKILSTKFLPVFQQIDSDITLIETHKKLLEYEGQIEADLSHGNKPQDVMQNVYDTVMNDLYDKMTDVLSGENEDFESLASLANELDKKGFYEEANELDNILVALAKKKSVPTNKDLWEKAKAAAKRKFRVYPCVPLNSMALTKSGWTSYDNLSLGDSIASYNRYTNQLEWDTVQDIHFYKNAELMEIGKATGFKVKCTPNHKWVVKKTGKDEEILIEPGEINKKMQIRVSAPMLNDSIYKLGSWGKYTTNWVENVLNMSFDQRETFLASAIVYDGWDNGESTKIASRHTFGFRQKDKDHTNACLLAAFLNGYHVNSRYEGDERGTVSATIIRNKQFHSTQNLTKRMLLEKEDVWCPTTKNGTWVMMQNGFITITGNSAYANAWAAKEYKRMGGGWKTQKKKKKKSSEIFQLITIAKKKMKGGLGKWFREEWVDVSRKDKDGKHPPCGRSKSKPGSYPKCRPKGEAKSMSKKEKENATKEKRRAERKNPKKGKGNKPTMKSHKKRD